MRDVVFSTVYFVLTGFVIANPWLGILMWVCLDYMNPHRFCYGFAKYAIPFSMITGILSMVSMLITHERRRFPITREVVLLGLFIIWFTFTSFFAFNDRAWMEWDRAIKFQLLIFSTMFIMGEAERIHRLVWIIVLSIGFFGVKGGIWTIMTGGASKVRGPSDSPIEDNNDIALVLVVIIPLMRYLQLKSDKAWVRMGLGLAMGLSSLAVVASYSRAGMLALVTVTIFMVMKSRRRFFFTVCLICCLLAIGMFMPQQWFDRMNTIKTYEKDGSALGRLNAWGFAWNVAKARPILGGGFRCFTPLFFRTYAPDPNDFHVAHSIFFRILGEHGFPGLFLFLALAACTWRSATWVRRHAEGAGMIWAADLNGMVQVALAGYAVGGAFSNLAYFGLPYHLMSIVVLTKVMVQDALAEPAHREVDSGAEGTAAAPELAVGI